MKTSNDRTTKQMNPLMENATIPLDLAVLCLDCNSVSDANRRCPACCSGALMNLSVVLNRSAEFAGFPDLSAPCLSVA